MLVAHGDRPYRDALTADRKRLWRPDRHRRRAVEPARREVLIDSGRHVGRAVARKDRDARALSRRVGHDLIFLKEQSEIDNADNQEQQRRQNEGELDEPEMAAVITGFLDSSASARGLK